MPCFNEHNNVISFFAQLFSTFSETRYKSVFIQEFHPLCYATLTVKNVTPSIAVYIYNLQLLIITHIINIIRNPFFFSIYSIPNILGNMTCKEQKGCPIATSIQFLNSMKKLFTLYTSLDLSWPLTLHDENLFRVRDSEFLFVIQQERARMTEIIPLCLK